MGRKTDTAHSREEALAGDPMSAPQSSVSASPRYELPSGGWGGGHVASEAVPGKTRVWGPALWVIRPAKLCRR